MSIHRHAYAITNYTQVISLGAGAVSFTHIVKAAEPLFSTLMSALILKSTFPWQVRFSVTDITVTDMTVTHYRYLTLKLCIVVL
jgi:Triose-phosphate Transporter family